MNGLRIIEGVQPQELDTAFQVMPTIHWELFSALRVTAIIYHRFFYSYFIENYLREGKFDLGIIW